MQVIGGKEMNRVLREITDNRYFLRKIKIQNMSLCANGWYDVDNWKFGIVPEIDFKWHYGSIAVSIGPLELDICLSILDSETMRILREWEFQHIENAGEIEDDWEPK
jgi:hypothetical protein